MSEAPTWLLSSQNSANVAAARTTHLDLFNASTTGVRLMVRGIYVIPALAAVTGVGLTWEVLRTTAVGTGGSARTPQSFDPSNAALHAGITARSKPTGGADGSTAFMFINGSSEETLPYASLASLLSHLPQGGPWLQPLVVPPGSGLKVDQTTSSNAGETNVVILFTVE